MEYTIYEIREYLKGWQTVTEDGVLHKDDVGLSNAISHLSCGQDGIKALTKRLNILDAYADSPTLGERQSTATNDKSNMNKSNKVQPVIPLPLPPETSVEEVASDANCYAEENIRLRKTIVSFMNLQNYYDGSKHIEDIMDMALAENEMKMRTEWVDKGFILVNSL